MYRIDCLGRKQNNNNNSIERIPLSLKLYVYSVQLLHKKLEIDTYIYKNLIYYKYVYRMHLVIMNEVFFNML